MRARVCILLAGLGLAAGGCATVAPPPPEATVIDGAGPAPAPEPVADHDWFFNIDGDTAHMAYGLAESDDLRLGLNCRRASGRLELATVAETGAAAEIHLESGGETERFPAVSEPSEVHDGVFLVAAAAASEPVIQRFRQVGWIAQWRDGRREGYAPHPGALPNIERFFAFCG